MKVLYLFDTKEQADSFEKESNIDIVTRDVFKYENISVPYIIANRNEKLNYDVVDFRNVLN